ncbi:MAG: hypothetical protein FJW26_09070 [Acidimicrobiia bacterium]|nr:hypothetical protein [Acidimicrobiia bacterium]
MTMPLSCLRFLAVVSLLAVSPLRSSAADERNSSAAPARQNFDYFLIITGSELLRGLYADEHTQFITRALMPLGYRCLGSVTVGDVPGDLVKALDFARAQTSLVITTGGLGPTSQDVTRQVLADYTRIELKESPQRLADLRLAYAGAQGDLRPILRGQALVPVKGTFLPNPNGTALGLVFDDGSRVIAALPGPTRELQPMVNNELVPYLAARFGRRPVGHSLTLRFAGIGQSRIDQIMRDHLSVPEDVLVLSSFRSNRVDITFSFPGTSPEEAQQLNSLRAGLLKHIGEYFYADDGSTLEDQVAKLLERQKQALAVSEIASAGAVSSSLLGASKISDLFRGSYVAASPKALSHLLGYRENVAFLGADEPGVLQLAKKTAGKEGVAWALAVGPLVQSNDGSSSVWVAAGSLNSGFVARSFNVRKGRELRRDDLATYALDLLRRQLSSSP